MEQTQTITALKAQKRNPERISVYLDGQYAFGLARIVAAWLAVGQSLSEAKIAQLRKQDALEKAYQSALHLLSYRQRSEQEIRRKLLEKGFDQEDCERVLERLKTAGLSGDSDFAQVWVENRQLFRPRSRRMLTAELRQKGVANDDIEQALTGLPDEEQLAYAAAMRSIRKWQGLDRDTFRKRLSGFLARKGFNYEAVSATIRKVWDEIQEPSAHTE
ncbi:MAG TPA: RecX family transcriptional regulator [Anaerolinea sp.]|nr:RecX family transcriptional regulator [Anaerolinea sp.]